MKRILLGLLTVFSISAFAAQPTTVDTSGLTTEQAAAIAKQVADMKKEPANISATVRKEAEAWGDLGTNMGKAMVGAAKEIGIAANEFSQTSLGKVTVTLVVYKLIGREILSAVVGISILIAGGLVLAYLLTTRRWGKVSYEYKPFLFGIWQRQVVKSFEIDNDMAWVRAVSCGAVIAITLLVGLQTIF